MNDAGSRRLAAIGVLSLLAGGWANIALVLSRGGRLSGGYIADMFGQYVFYGGVILIPVGAAIAGLTRRRHGVTLTLIAACSWSGTWSAARSPYGS
jgi:hypothetical protein